MRLFSALVLASLLFIDSCGAVDLSQAMDACPGAAKFIQAQISRQLAAAPPKAPVVTDEAKRHRLLEHEEEDQRLYEQLASGGVNPTTLKELQARNLRYLHKELGHAVSIPSIDEVGRDGLAALWLLIQHANGDIELQSKALKKFEPMVKSGEIDASKFALLSDRVLLASGKPQRFGSQLLSLTTGEPLDLGNPVAIERERDALGLMKLADYRCISEQLYKNSH
ncbi:hypothetical protein BRM22_22290 [Xanthomonas oryzae pv. oryzae]|uniref:Lipoprotein n=3 Tax=Xanthomonas oryzae TaxID=347 RepID=Q5H1Z2_XANOR|nr:conserved hypothetical protein [Xanthomonas oryzae pv. oryzae KACC 10331]AWK18078.1 hypothetical protein B9W05_03355 [Xanthomonas oryzae pv. oryzae]QUW75161.1 hypothetical protein KCI36_19370 [Xanthomonas oryzae]BAE68434.1 conserved hypothetical protein [Xanthomonas oryzae pv. oryzae MAFF 311018]AXI17847.1 hypothetical protein CDO19_13115 [Xanthomonas oryzae pv. oryzae]